ncbi:hypothetical protein Z517_08405 [Fonsecaea pedrosoi CBS 271.37]|uniref:Xylanolytic transcriptional activator regulatory domain-containing protein n=1 Tax=Fonsecaea pedrosoi CBS 271.37 TaxID=1442368 RepID=A0A0D2EWK6_9EURO|nr:uncharacterized protein Z517_08405 [Fonsecaea pedrosoi CBS 271.37]KIW78567.1 hypothetical protein Z517_08405 [Fonsecaea pedrosoi CBS 271.37]
MDTRLEEALASADGIGTLHQDVDESTIEPFSSEALQPPRLPPASERENCALTPHSGNWEHHGPGSWLSICSKPGLAWVSQAVGSSDFGESARDLVSTWTRRLTMDMSALAPHPNSEPEPEMAWAFVNAYFDESFESIYGVVHRPEFEATLSAWLRGESKRNVDVVWHALRKTIYAAGCTIYLPKHSTLSYKEIQSQAWGYFQQALSSLVQILFTPNGILSIRCILAMTFFAGGLGSPSLEYQLCSMAVRLAHAKGIHRQSGSGWSLSADEAKQCNWLFWAVYCCEKHIALRSGRPSLIDDDEISCQVPKDACPGSTIDVPALVAVIQQARILSQVAKRLFSFQALQRSSPVLLEAVRDLDAQLRGWRNSLPDDLKPPDTLGSFSIVDRRRLCRLVLIYYGYYGGLTSIHAAFAYPWISSTLFGHGRMGEGIREQIMASSEIVHGAARNMLVIAKGVEIKPDASQWAAFYFPMLGLINVFIYVLKHPHGASTSSDLALLDIMVGYFANMQFVTEGDMSYPFARDVANLARRTAQKAAEAEKRDIRSGPDSDDNVALGRQEFQFPDMVSGPIWP